MGERKGVLHSSAKHEPSQGNLAGFVLQIIGSTSLACSPRRWLVMQSTFVIRKTEQPHSLICTANHSYANRGCMHVHWLGCMHVHTLVHVHYCAFTMHPVKSVQDLNFKLDNQTKVHCYRGCLHVMAWLHARAHWYTCISVHLPCTQ